MNQKLWSRNFLFLLFGNLFVSIAFYFLITALPLYLVEGLCFSKSDAGIVLSMYIFTAVLIRPFAGPLLDVYGRKKIYLSALLVFGITFLGYPLVVSFGGLVGLRVVHGIAWGVLTTAGNTIAMDLLPENRRGEGIGYYGLAFTIAMAMGPFLASIIIENSKFDWLFISSTILAAIGLILILFIHFPKISTVSKFNSKSLTQIYAPVTFGYALLTLIIMMPYGAILNFVTIFCASFMDGHSSVFFLALAIGLTTSRIIAGKVFDKKGPNLLLMISFMSVLLSIPLLIYLNSIFFMGLSAFIMGIGYGISFPVLQLMINSLMPVDQRGVANSIFLTALDIGIAGGTVVMGFLSELLGLKMSFIAFLIFPLLGILIFYLKNNTNN